MYFNYGETYNLEWRIKFDDHIYEQMKINAKNEKKKKIEQFLKKLNN